MYMEGSPPLTNDSTDQLCSYRRVMRADIYTHVMTFNSTVEATIENLLSLSIILHYHNHLHLFLQAIVLFFGRLLTC